VKNDRTKSDALFVGFFTRGRRVRISSRSFDILIREPVSET